MSNAKELFCIPCLENVDGDHAHATMHMVIHVSLFPKYLELVEMHKGAAEKVSRVYTRHTPRPRTHEFRVDPQAVDDATEPQYWCPACKERLWAGELCTELRNLEGDTK